MVGCEFKNGHRKDMFSKEIGLHAQNIFGIMDVIVNINWGDLCDLLITWRAFILIMTRIYICASKVVTTKFGIANHLTLITSLLITRGECREKSVHLGSNEHSGSLTCEVF